MAHAIQSTDLEQHIRRWLGRLRLQRAVAWSGRGLIAGLAASLVAAIAAMLNGLLLRAEFVSVVGLAAFAGAAIAAAVAYAWPTPRLRAARFFDMRFGLRERVSTALELARGHIATSHEIARRQFDDAVENARRVEAARHLPLRLDRLDILTAGALAACALFVAARGDAFFQTAQQTRTVLSAVAEEVKQIEAIRESIQSNDALTEEQRRELLERLDRTARSLQEARSPEQATSVLTAGEEQLQALVDAQAQIQSQALKDVGSLLSRENGSLLQDFGKNLVEGDTLAAAEILANIDPSGLSATESDTLSRQLDAAAESLQTAEPELAQTLREAAQALRNRDAQAAQQALEQAAQTLTRVAQRIAQSEAARAAASQLGQGRQRVIAAGRGAQAPTGQSGQSGQGQSSQPGEGAAGSGAGRGEADGEGDSGVEAGQEPIDQGNAPGDGGERGYEAIYAPERLGRGDGAEVTLPGSGDPGGEVVGQGNTSPGSEGQSSVPYFEVFAAYAQVVRQAMDSGQVPPNLRDVVRDYFSSLEP